MRTTTILATAAAFIAGGGLACALMLRPDLPASRASDTPQPAWTEVKWPFPIDQWGDGKAYLCKAADCGTDVRVYVRAKVGFCDCVNGVADDLELDRISDFELMGQAVEPDGDGRAVTIASMKGRSRAFTVGSRPGQAGLSIGFNQRCDAIVATAMLARERRSVLEPEVLGFLASRTVLRWAEETLGL
jgi:hypothetical protein